MASDGLVAHDCLGLEALPWGYSRWAGMCRKATPRFSASVCTSGEMFSPMTAGLEGTLVARSRISARRTARRMSCWFTVTEASVAAWTVFPDGPRPAHRHGRGPGGLPGEQRARHPGAGEAAGLRPGDRLPQHRPARRGGPEAGLGIPEYWRFDETGEFHGTRLAGDRLVDGRYEPVPIETVGEGVLQGYSRVLNLTIRWDQGRDDCKLLETGEHQ